jgi:hypothetical protein
MWCFFFSFFFFFFVFPFHSQELFIHTFVLTACRRVKATNPQLLEDFCKALFSLIILQKTHHEHTDSPWNSKQSLPLKTCVEVLTTLLSCESQDEGATAKDLSSGLFVDWLETVDPEIIDVHPLVQRQILFR